MRVYALPLLTIFILMGTFGAFALMGPMHAEMGCPFMLGQTALCATNTLEHLKHWQVAFAGILGNTLVLLGLALFFAYILDIASRPELVRERVRLRHLVSRRPTLIQELFSRGILNPRVF